MIMHITHIEKVEQAQLFDIYKKCLLSTCIGIWNNKCPKARNTKLFLYKSVL